jgi:hypothetical protein
VQSRTIDLFYVPKAKIVSAFVKHKLQVDYPDKLAEDKKALLADAFAKGLTPKAKKQAAATLRELVGETSLNTYIDRVRAGLGALPQELRFIAQQQSKPVVFESIHEATEFLKNPKFNFEASVESFLYQITYSDGTEFERPVATLDELRTLHQQIERLAQHMSALAKDRVAGK